MAFALKTIASRLLQAGAALLALGCSAGGPTTHAVSGKLVLEGGDISVLAGGSVEGSLDGEPAVRASGEIKPDGSFTLETLQNGGIVKGARSGTFRARVILPDDDPKAKRAAAQAVNKKFLSFDSSGLSFKSPPDGTVTLRLSRP